MPWVAVNLRSPAKVQAAVGAYDAPRLSTIVLDPEQTRLFERIYRHHFDFVFRNVRRAGVADAQVDDAVQDVFLVALRRLSDYRAGSDPKSWLFAIVARVASNYRRSQQRRWGVGELSEEQPGTEAGPFERTAHAASVRLLHGFLAVLPEDQRHVFILAELEQMTAPEIATALDVKLNTVYSRLRVAREKLAEYVTVHGLQARAR
jgi:RNA polymerase sigma-70 factor, ECF subfamily